MTDSQEAPKRSRKTDVKWVVATGIAAGIAVLLLMRGTTDPHGTSACAPLASANLDEKEFTVQCVACCTRFHDSTTTEGKGPDSENARMCKCHR